MQRAAQECRDYAAQKIAEQYVTGRDVYGQPWPTPKDGGRPMVRSGALRSGYTLRLEPTGTGYRIAIGNKQDYAKYLQDGTPKMRPRTHVPRGVLPQAWREKFASIHKAWIARAMAGY